MRWNCFVYGTILILSWSCSDRSKNGIERLELLSSEVTGVTFINTIIDNDSVNILSYEYLYNGGGIGILDVNNDGLKDILFGGSQVSNALYLNKGNFQFENISISAGVSLVNQWCTGISIVDINLDGYDDIYISVGGMGNKDTFPNKLFINQKDNTFLESAEEYGLADPGESIQAAFFDYDLDGDLDMYLLTGGGFEKSAIAVRPIQTTGKSRNADRLYENNFDSNLGHAVFQNASKKAGILTEGFGLGISIIDANQDQWPDIYVSNDYISKDLLYINNHNGTFSDQSHNYLKHTSHFSMGNDVADINNDGLMDVVTLDMLPEDHKRRKMMAGSSQFDFFHMAVNRGYGHQYMRNALQLNHGHQGFSEIGQLAGIDRTDWSWAPLLVDLDNDGHKDLYITNGFGRDITDLDYVKFRKDAVSHFDDRKSKEKLFLDSLKKRPAIKLPNYLFKNLSNLNFSNQSESWGIDQASISSGAAYADLDNDGDLEVIVNNLDQEAFIYKNNTMEIDSGRANYLNIDVTGPPSNPKGIGTKVSIYHNESSQHGSQYPIRGFQSSVENSIHFGLGTNLNLDSIILQWADGKRSFIGKTPANTTIQANYNKSETYLMPKVGSFKYFSQSNIVEHQHIENNYHDQKRQALLMRGSSYQGPGIAIADVNGDSLDDLFVGGAYLSQGQLYIQSKSGDFSSTPLTDSKSEDLGAIFFDADGDFDNDLYVVSGGSERYEGHGAYQDKLYLNDGNGNFVWNESALPIMLSSTAIVVAGDFDQDGDNDLFVGGRITPGKYPQSPSSYLLENQSGKFVDVTQKISPSLKHIGMVTSAIWSDIDNDTDLDLILAGEFMRITILENDTNHLNDITDQTTLANSYGMWNSLLTADMDNDGDMDIIAGNIGLNTPFEIHANYPLEVHYSDFDENGAIDPVFSEYVANLSYPVASLDQLIAQVPKLKKDILLYRDYARTSTNELLKILGSSDKKTLSCQVAATTFIENTGNGQFQMTPLPIEAQMAPTNGILAEDINLDGYLDLIITGNDYDTEVTYGRYDASVGLILINSGNGTFNALPPSETNFFTNGNTKSIGRIEVSGGKSIILVGQNNDQLLSFELNTVRGATRIAPHFKETSYIMTLSNGQKRKVEFAQGQSYLSQSSKSIVITPQVKSIELYDTKGQLTRKINI